VDTETESGLAGSLNIRAIPTLMVLRDGVLLAAESGVMPDEVLDDLITQVRALDMDEVRRRVEEQRTEASAEAERP
jgi:thioredoxin-like negative regulator of GroEL